MKLVINWASALSGQQLELAAMEAAWAHAKARQAQARSSRASLLGAAGAYVTATWRLGWTTGTYHEVVTRDGSVLDLLLVPPRTAFRHVDDDWAISIAASTSVPAFTHGVTAEAKLCVAWGPSATGIGADTLHPPG